MPMSGPWQEPEQATNGADLGAGNDDRLLPSGECDVNYALNNYASHLARMYSNARVACDVRKLLS